jgi:hypothetical protein
VQVCERNQASAGLRGIIRQGLSEADGLYLCNVMPVAIQCAHIDPVREEEEEVPPLCKADAAVLVGVDLLHEAFHLPRRYVNTCREDGSTGCSSGCQNTKVVLISNLKITQQLHRTDEVRRVGKKVSGSHTMETSL